MDLLCITCCRNALQFSSSVAGEVECMSDAGAGRLRGWRALRRRRSAAAAPPTWRGAPKKAQSGAARAQGAFELPAGSAGSHVQRPDPASPRGGGSMGAARAGSDARSSVTAAAASPGGGGGAGCWAAGRQAVDPAVHAQWERLTDAERDAAWEAQQEAWELEDEALQGGLGSPADTRTPQELWAEFLGGRTLREVQGDFNGAYSPPPPPPTRCPVNSHATGRLSSANLDPLRKLGI